MQPVLNGYPIPDPNPKFFSIPDPYPICFQNLRVFRVSGISEYYVFDMENGIKEQQDFDQYHLISSSLDLTGLIITSMYCGLISIGSSSIIMSPLCFNGFAQCYCTKLYHDYQRWRNTIGGNGINLFTKVSKKELNNVIII